jgi:hypothetical protein
MIDFDSIPEFMLDHAIAVLEKLRNDIETEISSLRQEKNGRDWTRRRKRQMNKILQEMMMHDLPYENAARIALCEQGHSWKYAGEILDAFRTRMERQKKAARELEIFRRWHVGKEKKTALAREYGLSRSTVERLCKKLSLGAVGLEKSYALHAKITNKKPAQKLPIVT